MAHLLVNAPFHNFDRLFEHSLRSFPAFTDAAVNAVASREFKPRMDLHEDSEKNLVSATFEFPGVKKEDIQLEVRDSFLTVSAENKTSTELEENGYIIRERRSGKFSRSLRLPKGINDADIKAAMEDGILTITFPRTSPEQEPRRISVA
ncbi:hypothetical protein NP233_g4296 [Leucocoprinus birnbaumii]|uniref:HSP20-like chaperone n=1 Tax=Leucocoprinus birnbaumii TaxID=56174 RepID=A0AAD5YSZ0_9AGAR|nr:hypothetical protein NP233_g4296 [Leucocoprinus birnbaumii]